jgi:glycerol-3-phosphate acyltransferase PlsY
MTTLIILLIIGYFIGSLPFGVWVARAHGVDIQKVGSGNVGATNVSRALGKWWGTGVFLLDMTKGLVPALLGRLFLKEPISGLDPQFMWFLVGFAAIAGHVKSPFLGFKGGKGVSTAMGAGLGAVPVIALSAFAIFVLILLTVQWMVVASIVGVLSAVALSFIIPGQSVQTSSLLAVLAIIVTLLHRTNFVRLFRGEEPKFKFRK